MHLDLAPARTLQQLAQHLALFRGLRALGGLGFPVLVGVSRKSMIGQLTGRPVHRRLAGGLALATLAADAGVRIVRTHDVAASCDALKMVAAINERATRTSAGKMSAPTASAARWAWHRSRRTSC